MQEKTLKEEFEEKFGGYFRRNNDEVGYSLLFSFISSREEKAREEGRKEAFASKAHRSFRFGYAKEAITQYKEELLDKFEEEFGVLSTKTLICTNNKKTQSGCEIESTNGLSEIKKLL